MSIRAHVKRRKIFIKISYQKEEYHLIGIAAYEGVYQIDYVGYYIAFVRSGHLWVESRVSDELCVSKISFLFENIHLIEKCYESLLLYSPSTTQNNFLLFTIPIFVKSQVGGGLSVSKINFHLENINLIVKYYQIL